MESTCRASLRASFPSTSTSASKLASKRPSHFAALPWHPPSGPFHALLRAAIAIFPRCNTTSGTACMSASLNALVAGGGGGGGIGGAGLGGDGGGGEGDKLRPNASGSSELGAQPDDASLAIDAGDVIVLSVGGMSCGGCASSVKNILESQPHVASASVNLSAETAIVKVAIQEQSLVKQEIAEALAKHLTNCGFKSSVREELIGG